MKKTGCVVAIAVIFVLLAGISANPAYAVGCKNHYIACCIDRQVEEDGGGYLLHHVLELEVG